MWKRIGVVVLWVLATVGTASITLAAVNSVGDHVTEQAAVPIDSEDLLASPAVQALSSTTTTTIAEINTTVPDPTFDMSTTTTSVTTTTAGGGGESSGTTAPPVSSTTTSTTAAGVWVYRATDGGTVTVWFDGVSVTQPGVVTESGWTSKIEKSGPSEVVVEFESVSTEREVHYHASVEDGQLVIDIDESHDD